MIEPWLDIRKLFQQLIFDALDHWCFQLDAVGHILLLIKSETGQKKSFLWHTKGARHQQALVSEADSSYSTMKLTDTGGKQCWFGSVSPNTHYISRYTGKSPISVITKYINTTTNRIIISLVFKHFHRENKFSFDVINCLMMTRLDFCAVYVVASFRITW